MVTMLEKLEEVKGAFCGDNPTTILNTEDHPPVSIGQKFSHHLWTTVPPAKEFQDPRLSSVRRNRSFLGTVRVRTMTELKERILSAFDAITDNMREAAFRDYERRLHKCLQVRGGHVD
ncbi:hypothetical protein HPB47_016927 [Ixodes persulcatus]|uniref:Uncharacterized protein n=1 Tax=Ixodes persulcatus TaxID=34615 RepID=A0AC60QPM6_IXOPE|nr:hypothetical protein HPB47_016927 [Ixodes persulcatus]